MVGRLGTRSILPYDYVTFHVVHALADILVLPDALVKHRRHGRNTSGKGPQPLREHARSALGTGAAAYRDWARMLTVEAQLYRGMAVDESAVGRTFIRLATDCEREAQFRLRRAELYEAGTRMRRLRLWLRMLEGRQYWCSPFGYGSAVKDLLVAIGGRFPRRDQVDQP
jgi:hypothetical protein